METMNMYDQFDFNVFMKRRGVMSLMGALLYAVIVLLQLFSL
jgi:hypothetical protein